MSHETFINEAISVTIEQYKLIESFCRENANSLGYDYRGELNRIAGYDVEKRVSLSDDSLKAINKMKQGIKDGIFSRVIEAGASERFCKSSYSKWQKLSRDDLEALAERAFVKYSSKTSN